MSRTVILLNANYDAKHEFRAHLIPAYTDAVRRAGGIPLIVPYQSRDQDIERVLDCGGALIVTGGADIDPTHYGEARHAKTNLKYEKAQHFDLELARRARKRSMPVLGICLGAQQLNVAFGGTLYQDLREQVNTNVIHWSQGKGKPRPLHLVRIEPGTRLYDILGEDEIMTNSSHHQAIKKVGENLRVCAHCVKDDVIEAVEDTDGKFFLGVQWHPETMAEPGTVHMKLFEALVAAAQT